MRSEDEFASLHQRVEHMLAGKCTYGPVSNNESLGRFFEVVPCDSGCRILVFECDFLTQQEWQRKSAYITEQTTAFLSKTNRTPGEAAEEIAAMVQMRRLPKWSYKRTGVDIDVQAPEVAYPELAKQSAAAWKLVDEIARVLKAYNRASPQGAASRPLRSERIPRSSGGGSRP
jgi:hypothetical protein